MDLPEIKDNAKREISALRGDLQDLKKCQLQYFTLTITGTGAIFGLSAILGNDFKGLALLAPLALILPCWLIFFDKVTTITRIVGYQRCLEEQIVAEEVTINYLGYENALGAYRAKEHDAWKTVGGKTGTTVKDLFGMVILRTRHRFWMLHWYTFALLSGVCWCGSYAMLGKDVITVSFPLGINVSAPERTMWAGPAFLLVAMCLVHTGWLILSLTCGKSSYNACTKIWKHILVADRRGNRPGG